MHDEGDIWVADGQRAGMLSFKSQRKLGPEDLSNVTSDGRLGRRQPDSVQEINKAKVKLPDKEMCR